MPLPDDPNQPWPPKTWEPIQCDINEAAVWYAGDEKALEDFYGQATTGPARPSDRRAGSLLSRVRFWSRKADDRVSGRLRLHAPVAADVAATSADLLFGDAPILTIPEAHDDTPDPEAVATEERLIDLAEVDGWASTLLEGAEVCSGLGLVFLRPVWDTDLADHPILTVVHGDHAVPEYRWGQLTAVTFWRVVQTDGAGAVWRHLERYEKGAIFHGLYVGTTKALGSKVDLSAHSDTKALAVDADGAVTTIPAALSDELLVRDVPNAFNRKHRDRPVGRSDCAGNESLMDSIDRTWTSLIRDVDLGQGRVIVPSEFLNRSGRGDGASFDKDQEIFSRLDMDPANMEKAGITVSQFAIRAEDHLRIIDELRTQIVSDAGYSPQTFGLEGDGQQKTATEVDDRKDKSLRTTAHKQRSWRRGAEDVLEMMLVLDRDVFGSGVEPFRPRMTFVDPDEASPREIGSTLNLLKLAEAVSIETRVKMLHRDWDQDEVDAEVEKIKDELGVGVVPDPTGFPPAGGQNDGGDE